jgi:hypothetical protein
MVQSQVLAKNCTGHHTIERELKWAIPAETLLGLIDLSSLDMVRIEQRYFPEERLPEAIRVYTSAMCEPIELPKVSQARIRSTWKPFSSAPSSWSVEMSDSWTLEHELVLKGRKYGAREEERFESPPVSIPHAAFPFIAPFANEGLLQKDRYLLPTETLVIEIDLITGAGQQTFDRYMEMAFIEAEFSDEEALQSALDDPVVSALIRRALPLWEYPEIRRFLSCRTLAAKGMKGKENKKRLTALVQQFVPG